MDRQSKLTVVYGGWWGSEGKGDVVAALTQENTVLRRHQIVAIRVGGPNAGHTIQDASGRIRKLQSIPVSVFVDREAIAVIGASAVIAPEVLARELLWLAETWESSVPKVVIDTSATVIFGEHHLREINLTKAISSTGEGVGAATADKAMRVGVSFADWCLSRASQTDHPDHALCSEIASRVVFADTVSTINGVLASDLNIPFYDIDEDEFDWINRLFAHDLHVIVEGTQGTLLSLNVGGFYPYCTSRDCTPEAILGQVGLSPRAFGQFEAICVFRTFPIRVGGPSGPMGHELTWEEMTAITNGHVQAPEITTVTGKERRIARWDNDLARKVVALTRPTSVAITFLDYVYPEASQASNEFELFRIAPGLAKWIAELEIVCGFRTSWVSTAPHNAFRIGG